MGHTQSMPTPATVGIERDSTVKVANIVKRFGDNPALDGVSFEAGRGELVVLLGRSGSGKSTLLRHLNGLEVPTSGAVQVLGEDLAALNGASLRRLRSRVGFIFQQFELVPSLTVLENVLTGSLAVVRGPRLGLFGYGKVRRLRALEHLETVGLLQMAYQRADILSGGQQQRVAIARALMQEPEILLADEPVASLDPESSDQVMNLIRDIARDKGLTVVCSLHQVDLALSWADRIVGLRHGKVVLNTVTEDMTREEAMGIYGQVEVATITSEFAAIAEELDTPGHRERIARDLAAAQEKAAAGTGTEAP
ncbi:phosphonate transport system ATP-binding protein [Arthrobacter alpinus]|uniref:Phosphonate transport system ATP-binding protein n=1 Tax=Arthrobacter alpinus TaxID=656366 RepID=A0A1H5ISN7_9MICC|nr:phosphonate ABC transporter ATP-binding protein [Arthrobacter alpinus]SEE42478.1 phosphonate transport system ATP-binding protein [Arthrobacter alpinus]